MQRISRMAFSFGKRSMSSASNFVKIVEVGPRDGLQNEPTLVDTATKLELIERLVGAGLPVIEAGAFVSPKWVPQMADTPEIFKSLPTSDVSFPALCPNLKGLEAAMKVGVKEIAVFGAASESFSRKNINCSIEESLQRFSDVIKVAVKNNIKVRGYGFD
jgi:isopropylmalate/homocitrate/citramalate synthase